MNALVSGVPLIQGAISAAIAADRAQQALVDAITERLRHVIYPGLEIDLRDRTAVAECFRWIRLPSGVRNTRLYRVASNLQCGLNTRGNPLSARWSCQAFAVSETTGKVMKPQGYASVQPTTVRIGGAVFEFSDEQIDMLDEAGLARVAVFIDSTPEAPR